MGNNLVSILKKATIAPLIAFALSSGIKAQETNNKNIKPELNCYINFGYNFGISDFKSILDEEPNTFIPNPGTFYNKQPIVKFDLDLGMEPAIKIGKFELGFPIYGPFSTLIKSSKTAEKMRWNNSGSEKRRVKDILLKRKTPSFGVSLRIGDLDEGFKIQFDAYKFKAVKEIYWFGEVSNGNSTTVTTSYPWGNSSSTSYGYYYDAGDVEKTEKLNTGWAKKISLGYSYNRNYLDHFIGFYVENASIKPSPKEASHEYLEAGMIFKWMLQTVSH